MVVSVRVRSVVGSVADVFSRPARTAGRQFVDFGKNLPHLLQRDFELESSGLDYLAAKVLDEGGEAFESSAIVISSSVPRRVLYQPRPRRRLS